MFVSHHLTGFRIQKDKSVRDPTHTALETCQAESPMAHAGPPLFPGDSNKAPTPLMPSPQAQGSRTCRISRTLPQTCSHGAQPTCPCRRKQR